MAMMLPKVEGYQRAKLSADDFWVLADSGAFEAFAKTELIDGEIYVVNSVHRPHSRAHAALTVELGIALKPLGLELILMTGPSTNLTEDSVPEPDIALGLDGSDRALRGPDLLLAIEISDSTLSFDKGPKLRLYARAGVPEYWIVDVNARRIYRHAGPQGEEYRDVARFQFGEPVPSATIAGLTVDTATLT